MGDVLNDLNKIVSWFFQVTVIECSRLVKTTAESYIYCTLAIGKSHAMNSEIIWDILKFPN